MAQSRNKYSYNKAYYEQMSRMYSFDGSAARKLAVAEPELEEEYEPEYEAAEPVKEQPVREEKKNPSAKNEYGVKIKRSYSINLINVMVVLISITALLWSAGSIVKTKSDINQNNKAVAAAEKSLLDVNALNESLMTRLDTGFDRNYIYSVAVGRLNMVYPNENTVVYYKAVNEGHVKQYANIQ